MAGILCDQHVGWCTCCDGEELDHVDVSSRYRSSSGLKNVASGQVTVACRCGG